MCEPPDRAMPSPVPPDRAMPSPAYVQVAAAVEDDSSLPVAAVVLTLTWMAV